MLVPVSENRTRGTQGTALDEGKKYRLKNALSKIKKGFARNSKVASSTEKTKNALF